MPHGSSMATIIQSVHISGVTLIISVLLHTVSDSLAETWKLISLKTLDLRYGSMGEIRLAGLD